MSIYLLSTLAHVAFLALVERKGSLIRASAPPVVGYILCPSAAPLSLTPFSN